MVRFFRTKNRRERTEYLMPPSRQALIDWRDHLKKMLHRKKIKGLKSDHVFCRLDGTPIKRFDKAWRKVCKEAGIKGFHFHDLRHTFCSNLLLAGSNLKNVKEMIGHNDLSMTDRYSHLTLEHKRVQQTKLIEHYASGK
jgi:site-specific recombinase XerD